MTILQTLELGHSSNLKASSYGHYYEYLITQSLNQVVEQHDELDAIYSYLTELAYKVYSSGRREISKSYFRDFHDWYCEEYTINPSLENYIQKLDKSSIIEKYAESFSFKYRYVYYFFVARYYANNISTEEIRKEISSMSEELYRDEYANIFMFLTHLSKDPFILDEILSSAKEIFESTDIIKFENDVESINNLLDELPKQVLRERNYEETRKQRYKLQDKVEFENDVNESSTIPDDENEIDLASDFNRAYKSLEILGQILKNYYGSLKGQKKYELGEEAYQVGLRALNCFFEFLEDSSDIIVDKIQQSLKKDEDSNKEVERFEIERKSREIFFKFAALISYSFIKKISTSVGYDKLEGTFKQILDNNSINSIKLIDASIKLDHYRGFPYEELKDLKKEFGKNPMARVLLERMVINYLYMFPTNFKERQRICSIFDIPMRTQRAIEGSSTRQKS